MKWFPVIAFLATVAAEVVAIRVVQLHWPSKPGFFAFLLILFVLTPLLFLFCLDALKMFKAQRSSTGSAMGRILFSMPIVFLALAALLVCVGMASFVSSALLSGDLLPFLGRFSGAFLIVLYFGLIGLALLRFVFTRTTRTNPLEEKDEDVG